MSETKEIQPLAFDVDGAGFDEAGLLLGDKPTPVEEVNDGNE
ncbi:hypothetical protein [Caballeronia sp. INSB1]|nr:hypothetical protein [Caballeronia sp. INSB1]